MRRRVSACDNRKGGIAMTDKMYKLSKKKYGRCPYSDETLAVMIQNGDEMGIRWLLSENEYYLRNIAQKICTEHELETMGDDLKQAGALALIEAAKNYRVGSNAKLLTYAYTIVKNKMLDRKAELSATVKMPATRYHQLKVVGFLKSTMTDKPSSELLDAIQQRLQVSETVARNLLLDYKAFFQNKNLGTRVYGIYGGANPAKVFMNRTRWKYIYRALRDELSDRENLLVNYHLGLELPDELEEEVKEDPELQDWMTFEELAIRLNYNDHSAAEKAFKRAMRKVKRALEAENGELALWLNVWEMLQNTCNHPAPEVPLGYLPPVPWWDADEIEDTSEYD